VMGSAQRSSEGYIRPAEKQSISTIHSNSRVYRALFAACAVQQAQVPETRERVSHGPSVLCESLDCQRVYYYLKGGLYGNSRSNCYLLFFA
jgi:hypothetical protein